MTRLTRDQVLSLTVYAAMLALALAFVIGAFGFTGRQRLVPLVIGIPTVALLVFIIAAELMPRFRGLTQAQGVAADDAPGTDGTRVDAGNLRRVVTVYGWLVFFFVVTFVFGFYVSVPLFLFLFYRFESKLPVLVALALTVACVLPLLIVFRLVLDIPLWPGVLPMMVPGILGGGSLPPLL